MSNMSMPNIGRLSNQPMFFSKQPLRYTIITDTIGQESQLGIPFLVNV